MKDIVLNNGKILNVGINFLTIKMIGETNISALQKKLKNNPNDESLKIKIASKMIYVILRSSGLMLTEDETLILVPIDDDTIDNLFSEFEEKMNKFKKKQTNPIANRKK